MAETNEAAEPPQADPEPSVPSAPAGNEAETQEPSQIAGAAPETAGAEASQASQASASQDPVAEGAPGEPAEAPAESAQADGPSAAEEGNAENVVQEALAEHADANEADNRATVTEALAEHASPPEESPAESSAEAPKPQEAAEPVADPVPQQNPAEEPQSAEQDTAIEQALAEHVDAVAADHDEAISQALAEHASSASQENETLPGAGQQPTNDAAADGPPDAPPDVPHRDPSHADEPDAEDSAAKLLKDVRDDMGEPSQDHQDMHHDQSFDSFQSASPKTMNRSIRSSPGFTSHSSEDLKSKLQFSSMTTDGVKKGPTFMHTVSTYKTGQRWSFGQKGPSTFIASSGTPAPGSYNLHTGHGGGRYKSLPKFSFGGATRFAIGEVPTKKQPGPGAYNPRDPLLTAGPKVSFAGANAGRGPPLPENAPGPGAYEQRSTLGKSKMFTARGRQASSYMRSRSQPGPGAYDPKLGAVLMGIPKCGFGTSIRNDITGAARSLMLPGPGAYDMQSAMSVGKNGPKYSAASRRRVHDLDSYVTPGPGTYNAHTTSFVY